MLPPTLEPASALAIHQSRHWLHALSLAWTLADHGDVVAAYHRFRDTRSARIRDLLTDDAAAVAHLCGLGEAQRWPFAEQSYPHDRAAQSDLLLAAILSQVSAAERQAPRSGASVGRGTDITLAPLDQVLRQERELAWPADLFDAAGVRYVDSSLAGPGALEEPSLTQEWSAEELDTLLLLDLPLEDQSEHFIALADAVLDGCRAIGPTEIPEAGDYRAYRAPRSMGAAIFEFWLPGIAGISFAVYFPPGQVPLVDQVEFDQSMPGCDVINGVLASAVPGDLHTIAARLPMLQPLSAEAAEARLRQIQAALQRGEGHLVMGLHTDGGLLTRPM